MTEGLGAAILCLLLGALGYGAVFVSERARANPASFRLQTRTTREADLPRQAEELNLDLGHVYDPSNDASSPLVAEADYGWPAEEVVHTNGR
jgi:hypothetical protein